MTAQIPDRFRFQGQEYCVAGIHGQPPFEPSRVGLHPVGTCTACWRGFVAWYGLLGEQLVLERLEVNLGTYQDEEGFVQAIGPLINDKEPLIPVGRNSLFNNVYPGLDLPLDFTGGLLLARDFIQELYVHMGFHPAWKYREVWELIFESGKLTCTEEVSAKVAELRKKLARKPLIPILQEKDRLKWIRDTFHLDY